MTALEPIFERLGLQQYYHGFVEEGFDTWETVLDITESDLYVALIPKHFHGHCSHQTEAHSMSNLGTEG